MKIRLIIILYIILIFSSPALCVEKISEGAVLSLEDCINNALNNNPQLNIYQSQKAVQKSRIGQAKSDYFPRLGFSSGYSGQNNSHSNVSGMDDYYSSDINLNQLVYNFGKTGAKINMQKYYLKASEFDYDSVVIDTVYNVKSAYYGVLAARANIDVYSSNVRMSERQFERTRAFFQEGLKSKIDLVNAEVNLSNSKIEEVKAQNTYQNALIKLNNAMFAAFAPAYSIKNTETFNLVNKNADITLKNISNLEEPKKNKSGETGAVYSLTAQKYEILENYKFSPYSENLDSVIQKAYLQRPDIKALVATLGAYEENLKSIKREYYPQISAQASYGLKNTRNYNNNSFGVKAGIEIPVTNVMNTKCKIDEARANLDIAKNNLEMTKQNVYFEVQSAYVDMIQLEKQIPLMNTRVKQALENFELADGRYEVGLGNFIELQDAKTAYNNAQHSYVQVIYDFNTAKAKLEKAMGER